MNAVLTWCLGFLSEHAPDSSSARLTGIWLIGSAVVIAFAGVVFAFRFHALPNLHLILTAWAGLVTALGGFGGWAIKSRTPTSPSNPG